MEVDFAQQNSTNAFLSESLEREITALSKMNITELQATWRMRLKQAPPPHTRKQLLVRLLACKLQEQKYGGLKPEVKRRLREMANSFTQNPKKAAAQIATSRQIKPGTRLTRQWDGKTHHVTVGESGFEYSGDPLGGSQSAIRAGVWLRP